MCFENIFIFYILKKKLDKDSEEEINTLKTIMIWLNFSSVPGSSIVLLDLFKRLSQYFATNSGQSVVFSSQALFL